jgi:frataxin-like iron-binding protein CyaY
MDYIDDLTAGYVRQILSYDPATGVLTRRYRRPREGFERTDKTFNSRFAGKPTGALTPDGRLLVGIGNRRYLAHRLAWLIYYGEWPIEEIDHIDMNPLNNRILNLRIADHSENKFNRGKQINNSSGYKGVHFNRDKNLWQANLCHRGKKMHLGYFRSIGEACAAYEIAAERWHGEFARISQ